MLLVITGNISGYVLKKGSCVHDKKFSTLLLKVLSDVGGNHKARSVHLCFETSSGIPVKTQGYLALGVFSELYLLPC